MHLIALISAELTQNTLGRDNYSMILPKQMQFDIQKPSGGGKISHLITSADDCRLIGAIRVEVP